MPGIGGRFGWNEPPPAAITTTFASITSFSSVVTRNVPSSSFSRADTMRLKVNAGLNGAICCMRLSTRPCAEIDGHAGMS